VVEIGATGVHVPYTITWGHEQVADGSLDDRQGDGARTLATIRDLPTLLSELA